MSTLKPPTFDFSLTAPEFDALCQAALNPNNPSNRTIPYRHAAAKVRYRRVHHALIELADAVNELDADAAGAVAPKDVAAPATRLADWLQRFSVSLSIPF